MKYGTNILMVRREREGNYRIEIGSHFVGDVSTIESLCGGNKIISYQTNGEGRILDISSKHRDVIAFNEAMRIAKERKKKNLNLKIQYIKWKQIRNFQSFELNTDVNSNEGQLWYLF